MPIYDYAIVWAGWIAWMIPFWLIKRTGEKPAKLDRRARWGIIIQSIAIWMLWVNDFYHRAPALWRLSGSVFFFALGSLLSWSSARELGKQWRFDAGLNADHKLVQTGAYQFVRHPIYASMFCMLLGTGFMVTPLPVFAASIVIFAIGTEIRVRIEDGLLASRFGDQFHAYRRQVHAYVPLVR